MNSASFQRLLTPQGFKDIESFVDQLPVRAGQGVLLAAALAWLVAGCMILFASMEAKDVLGIRKSIMEVEALKPSIPTLNKAAVDSLEVERVGKKLAELYPQLRISTSASTVEIVADTLEKYGVFREAVGHLMNAGKKWRIDIVSMCAGRECKDASGRVAGKFNVYRLEVVKPAAQDDAPAEAGAEGTGG